MSKGNRKRRREVGLLPSPKKCAARRTNGDPCQSSPMAGQAVCYHHGGNSPQALRKARERLALAADDAVSVLIRLMQDDAVSASDRRQAATAILDRAGISTRAELELTIAPWQDALDGIVGELPDDAAPADPYDRLKAAGDVVVGEVVQATTSETVPYDDAD